jgi:hypothetical protein
MKAADLERMYQKEVALHSLPDMVELSVPVTYVRGRTLKLACQIAKIPEKRTTDGEQFLDDEMYAVTGLWIYRVD